MTGEEVYLASGPEGLVVKVWGHVTAKLCRELRHRIGKRYGLETDGIPVLVDLTECSYMDSTFLGLLASLNRQMCRPNGYSLIINNPSQECELLLAEVGLSDLVEIQRGPSRILEESERITGRHIVDSEFLLKAHEELMGLSEKNKKRFSLIQGILKKEAG